MAAIVKAVHPRLKEAGFRKRRHTFNRSAEPGVIQVINFQMGQKLPPGAEPIPPIRLDLYGLFTVNFGVAIEEAWVLSRRQREVTFPVFVNDYDCEIRERLGQLLGRKTDVWWELLPDYRQAAIEIGDAILEHGTNWLEYRANRDKILALWTAGGLQALPMPTALPIVMILRHQDRPDEAADALRSYYAGITQPAHKRYVHEVGHDLGITLPDPA
jgi:hypothetical protein